MTELRDNIVKRPFSSELAFASTLLNCFLVWAFMYGYEPEDYPVECLYLILLVPLQLGVITYFSKPPNKRFYLVLTIITLAICGFVFLVFQLLHAMVLGPR
jgi:hypothetical protein